MAPLARIECLAFFALVKKNRVPLGRYASHDSIGYQPGLFVMKINAKPELNLLVNLLVQSEELPYQPAKEAVVCLVQMLSKETCEEQVN